MLLQALKILCNIFILDSNEDFISDNLEIFLPKFNFGIEKYFKYHKAIKPLNFDWVSHNNLGKCHRLKFDQV